MKHDYNKHKKDRCTACGHNGSFYPLEIDHVKTRGSGGNDDASNCITYCRACHILKGQKGLNYMATKFPSVKEWLISNGWEYNSFLNKWVLNDDR